MFDDVIGPPNIFKVSENPFMRILNKHSESSDDECFVNLKSSVNQCRN